MENEGRLRDWQPGDRIGQIWPSGEVRNFSADGRAMGRQAAAAFHAALAFKEKVNGR